jgi:hypothetical protein
MRQPQSVELLILGAGWTSTFLIPLLESSKISYAATTTTGKDNTIPFKFDPESDDLHPYKSLPSAKTILITFPLTGMGQSTKLVELYQNVHTYDQSAERTPNWIQLGSTGIFQAPRWNDSTSPYNKENPRGIAEDELLQLKNSQSTVLDLAGLYDDGIRKPSNWVPRVVKSKEDLLKKQAVNLIHGKDVAHAIIAVHENFNNVEGRRWIVTDLFVYDWWALILDWGGKLEDGSDLRSIVFECMEETGCKALPRSTEVLGRLLDSRSFWKSIGVLPAQGRLR